ncbi:MAG: hypothetical protein ACR2LC_10175 [Pyrinomonadaceae bacterium]
MTLIWSEFFTILSFVISGGLAFWAIHISRRISTFEQANVVSQAYNDAGSALYDLSGDCLRLFGVAGLQLMTVGYTPTAYESWRTISSNAMSTYELLRAKKELLDAARVQNDIAAIRNIQGNLHSIKKAVADIWHRYDVIKKEEGLLNSLIAAD